LLDESVLSGMVTDRHWTGSRISDSCHGLVALSITSSTVLGFSTLRPMGSTPFFIEKAKINTCAKKY